MLMGKIRKNNISDYWSNDATIASPIFPHSESIQQVWHVSDNSQHTETAGRLLKNTAFVGIFSTDVQFSLQPKARTVALRGHYLIAVRLKFRTYNPRGKGGGNIYEEFMWLVYRNRGFLKVTFSTCCLVKEQCNCEISVELLTNTDAK